MEFGSIIFQLAVLLFSVVIHEVSHGYTARALGDQTAEYAGRLTLNPLKHLDPFGSVLFPFMMYLVSGGAAVFGWAKPVPYNPYNLKLPRWGPAVVGAAGPLSNITVALVFGLLLRFAGASFSGPIISMFVLIVYINILLAIFNLVPIPPLDGSRILFAVLPAGTEQFRYNLERYGFLLLLVFIFFGFHIITPIIGGVFRLITGVSFGPY